MIMGPCVRRDDDVGTHLRTPATHYARVVAKIYRPKEGVGNAGCSMHRGRAWWVANTRVSHHGYTGSPGIPARNGFNGFLRALPGDRALLSPSLANESANLTPASRRQDHTTSPSAPAPFVHSASASTASRSNVRDDRETPLCVGQDGCIIEVI